MYVLINIGYNYLLDMSRDEPDFRPFFVIQYPARYRIQYPTCSDIRYPTAYLTRFLETAGYPAFL